MHSTWLLEAFVTEDNGQAISSNQHWCGTTLASSCCSWEGQPDRPSSISWLLKLSLAAPSWFSSSSSLSIVRSKLEGWWNLHIREHIHCPACPSREWKSGEEEEGRRRNKHSNILLRARNNTQCKKERFHWEDYCIEFVLPTQPSSHIPYDNLLGYYLDLGTCRA